MSSSIDSVQTVRMAPSLTTGPGRRARGNLAPGSGTASRRIVAVLLLVIPLSQIGLDVYTPAMPKMAMEFAASSDFVQNTITAYMLGMSVAFLPVGLIADAFGRKPVLRAGLGLLVGSTIGCALAPNLQLLLGLRLVQGIGASACLLLAATIASDCFRGAKLVSVMGLLGAAWGAAPVLAPAIGGLVVQWGSWRLVFGLFAVLAALVALIVAKVLPETLDEGRRSPVDVRAAIRVLGQALRHRAFLAFVAMFGLIGAAQMVFGIVNPFLYEGKLGFSPAAYGIIALVVGVANLVGELACGGLAQRTTTRRLGLGALAVFLVGAVILVISAEVVGLNAWMLTAGAALALLGCGVLDSQSKGLAMGVFDRNTGLIAGLVCTCCYLVVSLAMAVMASLPQGSQATLGWLDIAVGVAFAVLLLATVSPRRQPRQHPDHQRTRAHGRRLSTRCAGLTTSGRIPGSAASSAKVDAGDSCGLPRGRGVPLSASSACRQRRSGIWTRTWVPAGSSRNEKVPPAASTRVRCEARPM